MPVVIGKSALLWSAGMVTEAGTFTSGSLLCSFRTAPPAGAGPFSVTVPVRLALPRVALTERSSPAKTAGCRVTPVSAEHEPVAAVMVAAVLTATGAVEI